jgi:hypothetical protein
MIKDCIELNLDWHYDATDNYMISDIFIIGNDDNEHIGKIVINMDTPNPEVDIYALCGKNMIRNAVLCNHRSIIDALIKEIDEVDAINGNEEGALKIDSRDNETNVIVEINLKEAIEELKKEL